MSSRKPTRMRAPNRSISALIAEVTAGNQLKDFKEYEALAEYFGVPLWIMFIPDLPREMMDGEKLKGLVQHVEEHVAERRKGTEAQL